MNTEYLSHSLLNDDQLTTDLMQPSNITTTSEKTFFTKENHQLLRIFQKDIQTTLDMTPTFRKIVNSLITGDNLATLKQKLLQEYNHL